MKTSGYDTYHTITLKRQLEETLLKANDHMYPAGA